MILRVPLAAAAVLLLVACGPRDEDGDGYAADVDCDDTNPAFNPGALEQDCDDPNDYNCDGSTGYADADEDGFAACRDCDDSVASTYPGADEMCDNVDNDCDGSVDDFALDAPTWYYDADGDTYGSAAITLDACDQPAGYVSNDEDCDDLAAAANPVGTEVCDGLDNDCNGTVDDGAGDLSTFYADADGDGAGDWRSPMDACDVPKGYVDNNLDCDDADESKWGAGWCETVTLTNCAASGPLGPDQKACDAAYKGRPHQQDVTVTDGIQTLPIPHTGTYVMLAAGAQGGSGDATWDGGDGALLAGSFELQAGEVLSVVVGQAGGSTLGSNGGGGGGTFVVDSAGNPLLVAGGGGGIRQGAQQSGCPGLLGEFGGIGSGNGSTLACAAKKTDLRLGGQLSSPDWYGAGGAGFDGDGADDTDMKGRVFGLGGASWANGMIGGTDLGECSDPTAAGGFGGGGSGAGCNGGGGGGGYSGGDGGWIAGGGGSLILGKPLGASINAGDGLFLIVAQ